jgi:hypothetical protein
VFKHYIRSYAADGPLGSWFGAGGSDIVVVVWSDATSYLDDFTDESGFFLSLRRLGMYLERSYLNLVEMACVFDQKWVLGGTRSRKRRVNAIAQVESPGVVLLIVVGGGLFTRPFPLEVPGEVAKSGKRSHDLY